VKKTHDKNNITLLANLKKDQRGFKSQDQSPVGRQCAITGSCNKMQLM